MDANHTEVSFLGDIIDNLTGNRDCYEINRSIDERGVLLRVSIDEAHAGRVLGKAGQTIMAIRQLMRVLGQQNDAHYNVLIEVRE